MKRWSYLQAAALTAALVLWPSVASADDPIAFVVMGPSGPVVRVITEAQTCPVLVVDDVGFPTQVRAAPETLPLRPTQSSAEDSKPSAFPARVCEAFLPIGAAHASLEGRALPLPPKLIKRIVVIGDTGCRLKASDHAYQACNDPKRFPFAAIAARAAAWKPDLVMHVGDFIYRENACPKTETGCSGSPWGYGLDVWKADLFEPGAPLLAVAPWVITRGNHESCTRGGQGWWRYVDPRPMESDRNCIDPLHDALGDYSAPFAVPLGGGAQVVVLDLSSAGGKAVAASDPRWNEFRDAYEKLADFAMAAKFTMAIDHYPLLGIGAENKSGVIGLRSGNPALQSVWSPIRPSLLPPKVDLLLSGHIHIWEQASFVAPFPSQFVAGFSGTEEDSAELPRRLPQGTEAVPGARVEQFSSWIGGFGYMTLERRSAQKWTVNVWDVAGHVVNRCEIIGPHSRCAHPRIEASSSN